jgi:hypothetical protein
VSETFKWKAVTNKGIIDELSILNKSLEGMKFFVDQDTTKKDRNK